GDTALAPAEVPNPQSVPAMTRSSLTHDGHGFANSVCHHLWMLDEIGRGIDDARYQKHVGRQRMRFESDILVLMPRIGEFYTERADFCLIENRKKASQGKIVGVRPFPVTPADMEPDPVTWNPFGRAIDSFNVEFHRTQELRVRFVLEHPRPLKPEIGRIKLQKKSV